MKRIARFFLVFILPLASNAQNASADFSKVHDAYLGNYLSLDFAVTQFASEKDQAGTLVSKGTIRKSKADYYSFFDNQELIISDNRMLNIDQSTKRMRYYQHVPAQKIPKADPSMLDSMFLEQSDSVRFLGLTSLGKQYSIYTSGTDIYRTDVTIDENTWLIREIVYYYPAVNEEIDYGAFKIVIHYNQLSLAKPDASYFNLNKYVENDKIPHTTAAYSKYYFTIIN